MCCRPICPAFVPVVQSQDDVPPEPVEGTSSTSIDARRLPSTEVAAAPMEADAALAKPGLRHRTGPVRSPGLDSHPRPCNHRTMKTACSASWDPRKRSLTGNRLESDFLSGFKI